AAPPQWYCSRSTRRAPPSRHSKVMHHGPFVSIRPDENAPAIGHDAVEDDRRGLCRAGQRLVTKTPLERGHEVTQLIVRQLRDVAAQQSKALPRLRETGSIARVRFAIAAVDLARAKTGGGPKA